jgi:hypothetical protein
VIVYPYYNPTTQDGDAALLVLSTPTSAPAMPLLSPNQSALLAAGTPATIMGWGETAYGQPAGPTTLQWGPTAVQDPTYCAQQVTYFDPVSELCALDTPTLAASACFGDSGGPLVVTDPATGWPVEAGITSRGDQSCSLSAPNYFTRVDAITSWVSSEIAAAGAPPAGTVSATTTTPPPATSSPAPPATTSAATTSSAPPPVAPPNSPGVYAGGGSRHLRLSLQVAPDGTHIVAAHLQLQLGCRHGHTYLLAGNWSWPQGPALIQSNHTFTQVLATAARSTMRVGHLNLTLRFSASTVVGTVTASVHARRQTVGLCQAHAVSFSATLR